MTVVKDIRLGIAGALAVIPDCQISPYMLSSPTHPYLYVIPRGLQYDLASARGIDLYHMGVVAETSLGSGDRAAQELMDRFMDSTGDHSVKAALAADRTLGGVCADSQVDDIGEGYTVRPREGGGAVLWVEWSVRVYVTGT